MIEQWKKTPVEVNCNSTIAGHSQSLAEPHQKGAIIGNIEKDPTQEAYLEGWERVYV